MTIQIRFLLPAAILGLAIREHAFPMAYIVLVVLMALDVIAGVLRSVVTSRIVLSEFSQGLARKGLIAVIVAGGHSLSLVSDEYSAAMPFGIILATAFSLGELLSIIRNAAQAGVTMPRAVIVLLQRLETMVK